MCNKKLFISYSYRHNEKGTNKQKDKRLNYLDDPHFN